MHGLTPQHALPNQPRPLRQHRITEHARSAVLGREGEGCFQVDRAWSGLGLAALLTQCRGEEHVVVFRFARPTKSHLTYQLLSMITSGRLKFLVKHGQGQA